MVALNLEASIMTKLPMVGTQTVPSMTRW
jgi:hypothetical protein